MSKRTGGDRAHRNFIRANGDGPWPCYGCRSAVLTLLVHHLDEDPTNDAPENLVAMHKACHNRLHHGGKLRSAETCQNISVAKLGKSMPPFTDAHRAALSAAIRGTSRNFKQVRCSECDMTSTGGGISTHQRATGHHGKVSV